MPDTKKSSWFSSIKDAFVESVPDTQAASAPPPPAASSVAPPPVTGLAAAAPVHVAADPAALAKLEALLQSSLPPIYVTFMEQYQALHEIVPDEATCFKGALKTSKASPDQLAAAVEQLLGTMAKARSDFDDGFNATSKRVTDQAREKIAEGETRIQAREAQIKAMEEEVVALRASLATERDHQAAETQRLNGIFQGFSAAHAQIVDRLTAQKNRIASMKG